jgi:hypothetical protein
MQIFCCECQNNIEARLTDGEEVYNHRKDLYSLPFWICDKCKNFVGCHHKTNERTKPLGVIPNKEIKKMRMAIHNTIDPIWQQFKNKPARKMRGAIYGYISDIIGKEYHSADISNIIDAKKIYKIIKSNEFIEHCNTKIKKYKIEFNL